jgi:predicted amidohydrolase
MTLTSGPVHEIDQAAGLGVAIAQFAPGADKGANLAAITRLAERAASRGASIVVFPEYSSYFSDPFGDGFLENAEPLDGAFVTALGSLAARLGIHVVAGMIETTEAGERFSNAVVAVSPTGVIEAPETFAVGSFTVGLQTCYDIRFPEVSRRLVDAGADLVLVPAEWVRGVLKEHHWRTLVTARALENTIYVAAADHTPPIGVGASLVVDPMGVTIASLAENEDVAVAWIDRRRFGTREL